MAAYRRVNGLQSRADRQPVHRDQLRAQRSETSIGKLDLFTVPYLTEPVSYTFASRKSTE